MQLRIFSAEQQRPAGSRRSALAQVGDGGWAEPEQTEVSLSLEVIPQRRSLVRRSDKGHMLGDDWLGMETFVNHKSL
jgi:hypothetical protein